MFSNAGVRRLIDAPDVSKYVVFDVATDYRARAAILGLLDRGRRVAVVGDAIRAVAEETGRAVVEEMESAGARWVTTDSVVGVGG